MIAMCSLMLTVLYVFLVLGCVVAAKDEYEDGICSRRLSLARRSAMLPQVQVSINPETAFGHVCGLKASCCAGKDFNRLQSEFEAVDLFIDGVYTQVDRFEKYPDELLTLIVKPVSNYAFSLTRNLDALQSKVSDHWSHLVLAIDNQNVWVRFNTFFNLVLGYTTGVMCSMCDPYQQLYVTDDTSTSGSGSGSNADADADVLKVTLDYSICNSMSSSLIRLLQQIKLVLTDTRNEKAINSTLDNFCHYAGPPDLKYSKYPRQGFIGCWESKDDLTFLRNMLRNNSAPLHMLLLGCDSTKSCASLICQDTLQGLGYSWETVRANIIERIALHCTEEINCFPKRLVDYVEYFLETDEQLATRDALTPGAVVRNTLTELSNESRLDAERFGCGDLLSRHSCTSVPDVTFASKHIDAIVIASGVVGSCILLALILFCRSFKFRVQKRETPAWLRLDSLPFFRKQHRD